MTPKLGLSAPEREELDILREQLRKILRALDDIKDPETLRLITSGKAAIAAGTAGIPVSNLWVKLGLK